MSRPELDPRSLTAEERAIVEETVNRHPQYVPRDEFAHGEMWASTALYWEGAYLCAIARIEARRALFGGAEKEEPNLRVCPNCGKLTEHSHAKSSWADGYWRTRPEPAQVIQNFCPNCGEQTPYSHKSYHDDHYTCELAPPQDFGSLLDAQSRYVQEHRTRPEPAQPEPLSFEDDIRQIAKAHGPEAIAFAEKLLATTPAWTEPAPVAAVEPFYSIPMPEAVQSAIAGLLNAADAGRADALSDWWRSQPAPITRAEVDEAAAFNYREGWKAGERNASQPEPVAAGITAELERVLVAANVFAAKYDSAGYDSFPRKLRADIAAVRTQYGAGITQRRKLGKVREALRAARQWALDEYEKKAVEAALAELDEWEGR